MTNESKAWRMAKLLAAREDATRRLQLATLRMAWRDAEKYARLAAEAEEAITALRAESDQPEASA